MKRLVSMRGVFVAVFTAVAAACHSAPFAEWLEHVSPEGKKVRIWAVGDEASASFEAEDGHAVLFDRSRRQYVYARKNAETGALEATEFEVGDEGDAVREFLAEEELHGRDTSEAAFAERRRMIAEYGLAERTAARWKEVKAAARARRTPAPAGLLAAPPSEPTLGKITGLTVLVDFPITNATGAVTNTLANTYHPEITLDTMNELANGEECTLFGNASSVRKYFEDVSCGNLSYTNIVLGYFQVKYPRDYYDDPDQSFGARARELIGEVLAQINANSTYKTLLQQVSYSGNEFLALNVWFAGPESSTWSVGLWAHKWELARAQYSKCYITINGRQKHFAEYQISPITSSPSIGTFCHENGHMICGFPDLYDYAYGNGGAAGAFTSLMNYSGTTNPIYVDAYLRAAAGWVEPQELPDQGWVTVSNRLDSVWKYPNPDNPKEYYLIENRQKTGRDADLPASGIYIWRCDENGDNMYPTNLSTITGDTSDYYRQKCELSLEQADGNYEYERRTGKWWDTRDTWYSGNTASKYKGIFNASSTPFARWADGTDAGIWLTRFSESGDVMKFYSGPATTTTEIPVPYSWLEQYESILSAAGGDYEAAALAATGKTDGSGEELAVWHDYVAGTDPTDTNDTIVAQIEIADGVPAISWEPNLNEDGEERRIYTVWGKSDISDASEEWSNADETPEDYHFFKVTVEMP